jgi:parvulin-like peptidyl-prolyl isomerase
MLRLSALSTEMRPQDRQWMLILAQEGLLREHVRQQILLELLADKSLDPESSKKAFTQFAAKNNLHSPQDLERYRVSNLLTPAGLDWHVLFPLKVRQYAEHHFSAKANSHFLKRKADLDRVIYSLLRVQDSGLATELYLRLQDDEASFADLVQQYSTGPEKDSRGLVGPVPLSQAHPQFVQRLRSARLHELNEPFQIDSWWLIFRLEAFKPAVLNDQTLSQMCHELFDQSLEALVAERCRSLQPLLIDEET